MCKGIIMIAAVLLLLYYVFYDGKKEGFLYPEQGSMPFSYNSLPPEIWARIYASTVGDINPDIYKCQSCTGVINR